MRYVTLLPLALMGKHPRDQCRQLRLGGLATAMISATRLSVSVRDRRREELPA